MPRIATAKRVGQAQIINPQALEEFGLSIVRATRGQMRARIRDHVRRLGSDPDTDELRAPRFTMSKETEPGGSWIEADGSIYSYPPRTVIVCRMSGRYRVREDA